MTPCPNCGCTCAAKRARRDAFVSAAVVALALGCSKRRVEQLIVAGVIPAERTGKRGWFRVPRSYLDGFEADLAADQKTRKTRTEFLDPIDVDVEAANGG